MRGSDCQCGTSASRTGSTARSTREAKAGQRKKQSASTRAQNRRSSSKEARTFTLFSAYASVRSVSARHLREAQVSDAHRARRRAHALQRKLQSLPVRRVRLCLAQRASQLQQ